MLPLREASELLLHSQTPLLICHVAPDGDAIGSLLGLDSALRQIGKSPTPACADVPSASFSYLPGFERITQQPGGPGSPPFDLVVSLDASDLGRLGALYTTPALQRLPLLNIDHHVTNLYFGTLNLVDVEAASTTQVLYYLLTTMGIQLSADTALALLNGLVTDTRGFRTDNVTPQVMQVALDLMRAGASLPLVARNGLDRRPVSTLRLWALALARAQFAHGVAWTVVTLEMRDEAGARNGDTGLSNLLLSADGVDAAAVFAERSDGSVEIGFRAMPGFDVAQLALEMGGGGHTLAAGCSLHGSLDDAVALVLPMLQDKVRQQRLALTSSP